MPIKKTDDVVDLGLAYTFPASDPPSYMASIAVAGIPPRYGRPLAEQKKREAAAACADGVLDEELEETLRDKMTGG
jgi:hypothetical protein